VTAALLFDLDGTLIDSDGAHLRAFQRVFGAHGIVNAELGAGIGAKIELGQIAV